MTPQPYSVAETGGRKGLKLLLTIKRDPLQYFTRLMEAEGAYAWLNIGGRPLVMLNDAAGIEHVLQSKAANYSKGHFHKVLKPLFGDSMFLNEGPKWRRRREEAAPVFAHGNFAEMVRQMAFAAEAMFARWDAKIAEDQPIDATLEMTRFALDALLRALFHESRDEVAAEMRSSLGVILRDAEGRMWSSFRLPEIVAYNLPKYRAAQKFLRALVNALIGARRENKAYPEDLLSRLVNDFGMNADDQKLLYDEVLSFVLAGHDTTAHGLAWALRSLSLYPEALRKMNDEVAAVLGNAVPTMETIKRMPYTRQVFEEVMRLFPPVWTMSREAAADDLIPLDDGTALPVKKGDAVMMCHYAVHRRAKYWPNPEAFDPERFTDEGSAGRPKYAWFPFGGGPRMCLGFRFAQVESVLALAMIAQRYEFALIAGQVVKPEPIITLRPHGSMLFRVRKKSGFVAGKMAAADVKPGGAGPCPYHAGKTAADEVSVDQSARG